MPLKSFIPAIFWALIIFFIISIPESTIPPSGIFDIPYFDKIVHIIIFAIFAFLLHVGFYYKKESSKHKNNYYTTVFISGLLFSGITEILQHFLFDSRNADFYDFVANLIGVFTGIIIFKYFETVGYIKVFKFLKK